MADLEAVLAEALAVELGKQHGTDGPLTGWGTTMSPPITAAVRAWLAEVLLSEAVVNQAAVAIADADPYVNSTWTEAATAALQAAVDVLGVRGE